jgi:hypothetical protein
MAYDLIRPAVTLYKETDPKIDMMAAVTAMNRIAQVLQKGSSHRVLTQPNIYTIYIGIYTNSLWVVSKLCTWLIIVS